MIKRYLDEVVKETKLLFVSYIQSQFINGKKSNPKDKTFSTSKNRLHLNDKNGLAKSFETDSTSGLQNNNIEITLQSNKPYAAIHNYGGFIRATPVSKTNPTTGVQRQTYKMSLFFWHLYFTSKNEYWKIMALSVNKKGGVNIPKRPYFDDGIKDLKENLNKDFVSNIFLPKMIEYWNYKMQELK
jgi:phage gpG-like protein